MRTLLEKLAGNSCERRTSDALFWWLRSRSSCSGRQPARTLSGAWTSVSASSTGTNRGSFARWNVALCWKRDRARLRKSAGVGSVRLRLLESPRVWRQGTSERSGPIAGTAPACPQAGERGPLGASEAEAGSGGGRDRAGADPRLPARVRADGEAARPALGAAADRLGQGRPDLGPLRHRSLEDARRPERSPTGRTTQPLPPLTPLVRSAHQGSLRRPVIAIPL